MTATAGFGGTVLPLELQVVREEDLSLKGLRVRDLKPELLRKIPVEAQNTVVAAVTADLGIAWVWLRTKGPMGYSGELHTHKL